MGKKDCTHLECDCYMLYDREKDAHGIMPEFQTKEAACADVAVPYEVTLRPGRAYKIPLLIGFDIPKGYNIKMYPRSSLLIKHGLISPVSVIDADYRMQGICWPVHNLNCDTVKLEKGTRVAQIELVPTGPRGSNWHEKDEERGEGGFGSTGKGGEENGRQ